MSGKAGFAPEVTVPMELTTQLLDMVAQWPERFTSKFNVVPGCWEWSASRTDYGYGRYGRGGRGEGTVPAHRMSLMLAGQDIDGMFVDHLCRNPPCVRPDHLEPVTHTVNVRRGRQANVAGVCRAGTHEWTAENILTEPGGTRRCRPCRDARESKYRQPTGGKNGTQTHCPKGHPYAGDNLYLRPKGSRECRTCHREQSRHAHRRKAGLNV